MDIVFSEQRVQRLCEDERTMVRALGKEGARKLKARLADLQAAQVMTDVKRGRPHPLCGNLKGYLALDLKGGKRLIVKSALQPCPLRPDGSIDWAKVNSIIVLAVGDYHD